MTSTTHMANTSQNSATHCVPHNHPHIMFFVIWAYRLYELFPLIVTRNICAYVCVCAYIDKHNCRYRYMCITVIYTTTPVTVYNYIHASEWHSYFLAIDLPLLILLMFATLGILYECIIIYPYNIYIYIYVTWFSSFGIHLASWVYLASYWSPLIVLLDLSNMVISRGWLVKKSHIISQLIILLNHHYIISYHIKLVGYMPYHFPFDILLNHHSFMI